MGYSHPGQSTSKSACKSSVSSVSAIRQSCRIRGRGAARARCGYPCGERDGGGDATVRLWDLHYPIGHLTTETA
jgi:hypothetical protein